MISLWLLSPPNRPSIDRVFDYLAGA